MKFTVTGLDQVQRRLAELPQRLVHLGFPKALQQAADVVAAEVRSRAPVGKTGLLREAVITAVEIDDDLSGGSAAVGFAEPQDVTALRVEYGHLEVAPESHQVTGHVPPHPFLRPSADIARDRAIEAFAAGIGGALEKASHG